MRTVSNALKYETAERSRLTFGSLCFVASACLATFLTQAQIPETDTTEPRRAIDSNGNISLAFFRSMYETRFNRLDTDADGFVSREEYLFLIRYPRTEQAESSKVKANAEGDSDLEGLPPQIKTLLSIDKIEFDFFDQDKDDRLSKAEMMAPVDYLSSSDIDQNGSISKQEAMAMFKLKNAQRKGLKSEE